jgi:flagellar protein FliO/FliZ
MHTGWNFMDWLQYLLSFALVIGLLLSLLWSLRKLQNGGPGLRKSDRRLQMIESLSVGPRQKIVLMRVDDREVLIGITAHQMTALSPWPETGPVPAMHSEESPP